MMPPRRVLAAVDCLPGSRAALVFAARLAVQCGAELDLLHALTPHELESGMGWAGCCRDLRQKLEGLLRSAIATPPAVVRTHLVEGNASDVIVHIAARESADVIVMGVSGELEAIPPARGSTLHDVFRRSPVPVFAIPSDWSPPDSDHNDLRGLGPVLAGVNMTCHAIDAALAACRLAQTLTTHVTLLHALPAADQKNQNTEDIERVVDAIRIRTAASVQLAVASGDVPEMLAGHSQAHPHGIIVLGRAVGTQPDSHPCSIATRTVTLCRRPVLLHTSEPPRPD